MNGPVRILAISGSLRAQSVNRLLLRAAEELGIDLSPASIRGTAGEPTAQEVEEGAPEDAADPGLASDENLEEGPAEEELALPADDPRGRRRSAGSAQRRSTTTAIAWPWPMHIDATP